MFRSKLDDLTKAEKQIVIAICSLADQLPADIENYHQVIAWVREHYFNKPGRSRGERPKGVLEKHEPRVRGRWQ